MKPGCCLPKGVFTQNWQSLAARIQLDEPSSCQRNLSAEESTLLEPLQQTLGGQRRLEVLETLLGDVRVYNDLVELANAEWWMPALLKGRKHSNW